MSQQTTYNGITGRTSSLRNRLKKRGIETHTDATARLIKRQNKRNKSVTKQKINGCPSLDEMRLTRKEWTVAFKLDIVDEDFTSQYGKYPLDKKAEERAARRLLRTARRNNPHTKPKSRPATGNPLLTLTVRPEEMSFSEFRYLQRQKSDQTRVHGTPTIARFGEAARVVGNQYKYSRSTGRRIYNNKRCTPGRQVIYQKVVNHDKVITIKHQYNPSNGR